ncbi:hypothetical protein KAR34_13185 [bacterium]|nr:hypothetical protein [bacterium]
MYLLHIRQSIEVLKRSRLLLSMWQHPDFRICTRSIALLVTLTFVLPFLTWAFERATYVSGTQTIQYLNQLVEIPEQYGRTVHAFRGGDRLVVHIQDLHCNYEVQNHIAKIIGHLAGCHNLRLAAIEGASEPVNVTKLSTFPVESVKQEVGDHFMRQGKISGAEFYAATGRHAIDLVGIENAKHYQAGRECVMRFLNNESQGYVWDIREKLEQLKPALYHPVLQAFDAKRTAFCKGELSLFKYCRSLYKTATRSGLNMKAYAQLVQYATGQSKVFAREIDADKLYQEMDQMDRDLREGLYTHSDQQSLDQLNRRLDIMEKLLNVSVSNDELSEYRDRSYLFKINTFQTFIGRHDQSGDLALEPEVYELEKYLKQVEEFYANADLRSRDFIRNLLARMKEKRTSIAVLVSGGYHTRHLLDLMRRQGISYISVKPSLRRADVANPYFSLLQKRRTPLEKLLAQNQNIISLQPGLEDPVFQDHVDVTLKAGLGSYFSKEKREIFKEKFARTIAAYAANSKRIAADLNAVIKGEQTLVLPFKNIHLAAVIGPKDLKLITSPECLQSISFKNAKLAFYSLKPSSSGAPDILSQIKECLETKEEQSRAEAVISSKVLRTCIFGGALVAFAAGWTAKYLRHAPGMNFDKIKQAFNKAFLQPAQGKIKPAFHLLIAGVMSLGIVRSMIRGSVGMAPGLLMITLLILTVTVINYFSQYEIRWVQRIGDNLLFPRLAMVSSKENGSRVEKDKGEKAPDKVEYKEIRDWYEIMGSLKELDSTQERLGYRLVNQYNRELRLLDNVEENAAQQFSWNNLHITCFKRIFDYPTDRQGYVFSIENKKPDDKYDSTGSIGQGTINWEPEDPQLADFRFVMYSKPEKYLDFSGRGYEEQILYMIMHMATSRKLFRTSEINKLLFFKNTFDAYDARVEEIIELLTKIGYQETGEGYFYDLKSFDIPEYSVFKNVKVPQKLTSEKSGITVRILKHQYQKAIQIIGDMKEALEKDDLTLRKEGVHFRFYKNLIKTIFNQFNYKNIELTAFKIKDHRTEEHLLSIRNKNGDNIGLALVQRESENSDTVQFRFMIHKAYQDGEYIKPAFDLIVKLITAPGLLYKETSINKLRFTKKIPDILNEENWKKIHGFMSMQGAIEEGDGSLILELGEQRAPGDLPGDLKGDVEERAGIPNEIMDDLKSGGAMGRHAIRDVQPIGPNRVRVPANPYTSKGVVDESVEWEFEVTLAPLSEQMAADLKNDLELFKAIAKTGGLEDKDQEVIEEINARARAIMPQIDMNIDLQKNFPGMYVIEDVIVVSGPADAFLPGFSWDRVVAVDQNLMRYAPARVRRAALFHELGEGIEEHAYLRGLGKRERARMHILTTEQMGLAARALGSEAQDGLTEWLEAYKHGILMVENQLIPETDEDEILEYLSGMQKVAASAGLRIHMQVLAATPEQAEVLEILGFSAQESERKEKLREANNGLLWNEIRLNGEVREPETWERYSEIVVDSKSPFSFSGKKSLVLKVQTKPFIQRMKNKEAGLLLTVEDVRKALRDGDLGLAEWNLPLVFSPASVAPDEAKWLISDPELRQQQAAWSKARPPRPAEEEETGDRPAKTERQKAEDERIAKKAAERTAAEEVARVFTQELSSLAETELERLKGHKLTRALQDSERMTKYYELFNLLKNMRKQAQQEAKRMKIKPRAVAWTKVDYTPVLKDFFKIIEKISKEPKLMTPKQVNILMGRLERYEELVRTYLNGMAAYHRITDMSGVAMLNHGFYNEISNQVIRHASMLSAANKRVMTLCNGHLNSLGKSPQIYKTEVQKSEESGETALSVENIQAQLKKVGKALNNIYVFYSKHKNRMPTLYATLGMAYQEMKDAVRNMQQGSYTQEQLHQEILDFYIELSALVDYDSQFYWMEGIERPAEEYNNMIRQVDKTTKALFKAMGGENLDVKQYLGIRAGGVLCTSELKSQIPTEAIQRLAAALMDSTAPKDPVAAKKILDDLLGSKITKEFKPIAPQSSAKDQEDKGKRFDLNTNRWATLGWSALFVITVFAFGGLDAGWFAQIWMAIFGTGAVVYNSRWLPGWVAVNYARILRAGSVSKYLIDNEDFKNRISLQFDRPVDFTKLIETDQCFAKTEEDKIFFAQWLVQDIAWQLGTTWFQRAYLGSLQTINLFLRALLLPHVVAQERMRVAGLTDRSIYLNPILPLVYYLSELGHLASLRFTRLKTQKTSSLSDGLAGEYKQEKELKGTEQSHSGLAEEMRRDKEREPGGNIRFNQPLLKKSIRLFQIWRAPRQGVIFILACAFLFLQGVARAVPELRSGNIVDDGAVKKILADLKRRYFPDELESRTFNPSRIAGGFFTYPAPLSQIIFGRYSSVPGQYPALDLYRPLAQALALPAGPAHPFLVWRQKIAYMLAVQILRYRSAEYYEQTLEQQIQGQISEAFWKWSQAQPGFIQNQIHRLTHELNPAGYLYRIQKELHRELPGLAKQSNLAKALSNADSSESGSFTRSAREFTEGMWKFIASAKETEQRITELVYCSELLKKMKWVRSQPVAVWNGRQALFGSKQAGELVMPREWLLRAKKQGAIVDFLRTLPFRIDKLRRKLFWKPLRASPLNAA